MLLSRLDAAVRYNRIPGQRRLDCTRLFFHILAYIYCFEECNSSFENSLVLRVSRSQQVYFCDGFASRNSFSFERFESPNKFIFEGFESRI